MEGILKKNPGGIGIVEPLKCGELVELCQVFFGMKIAGCKNRTKYAQLDRVMSSIYLLASR